MSASDFTPPPLAVRDYCPRAARDLQADGIEPLVARALAARGVSTRAEITPPLAALPSPAALSGAANARGFWRTPSPPANRFLFAAISTPTA